MSIRLLSAAWDLDIGSTEKMVLMSLCDHANDDGLCWPAIATICRKTSKSERTVRNALVELKKRKETGKLPRLQMRAGSRGAYHYSWTPATSKAEIVEDLKAQVAIEFDATEEDDEA